MISQSSVGNARQDEQPRNKHDNFFYHGSLHTQIVKKILKALVSGGIWAFNYIKKLNRKKKCKSHILAF